METKIKLFCQAAASFLMGRQHSDGYSDGDCVLDTSRNSGPCQPAERDMGGTVAAQDGDDDNPAGLPAADCLHYLVAP